MGRVRMLILHGSIRAGLHRTMAQKLHRERVTAIAAMLKSRQTTLARSNLRALTAFW